MFAFVFAVGCAVGRLWAVWPDAMSWTDWIQVAIALGAVGSALGAVFIASFSRAQALRDRVEHAKRYSKACVDTIIEASSALRVLANQPTCERASLDAIYSRLKLIDSTQVEISFPNAAKSLSQARSRLAKEIGDRSGIMSFYPMDEDAKQEILKHLDEGIRAIDEASA